MSLNNLVKVIWQTESGITKFYYIAKIFDCYCCGQWPNYMDKYVCSGINAL